MESLTIEREFNLPQATLYDAFKNPEIMRHWYAPDELRCTEAEVDFVVGGNWKVRMDGDTEPHIVVGEYLEIDEPNHMAFSWRWHTRETTTRVDLHFKPLGENQTLLTLIHSQFPDTAGRDQHSEGWLGCLQNLDKWIAEIAA